MTEIIKICMQLSDVLGPAAYRDLTEEQTSLARDLWMNLLAEYGVGHNEEKELQFLKRIPRYVFPDQDVILGVIEWYFYREHLNNTFLGPMNGQKGRQSIFREIVKTLPFNAVVETGTFRGDTTLFMADASGLPVFTAEAHPRYHAYSKCRLRDVNGAFVRHEDARFFLGSLAMDPFFPKEGVLFYLDAHWKKDLPLRDEVNIIYDNWKDFVIMIDDFEVPDDPGYRFDDYGNGNRLCLDYLGMDSFPGLEIFWPSIPSAQETGHGRGCVLLASKGFLGKEGRLPETLRRDQTLLRAE